jgi:DNA-binding response OmpR family regulator
MDLGGRINLAKISILLVDASPQGLDILSQIFAGFGARHVTRRTTVEAASGLVRNSSVDLILVNDVIGEESGYDFVHWLRRLEGNANSLCPVIILSGHTRRSIVARSRDCGANFLIAKPLSAQILLERLIFVSREKRPFLQTGDYIGPDRRRHQPSPEENKGRRRDDEPAGEPPQPEENAL